MVQTQAENSPVNSALQNVLASVEKAAQIAGRAPDDITLIAVSKTRSAEEIAPLLQEGQRAFAENRVQEAQEKWPDLKKRYPDIELHMVGQLQSNKAADAVELFDVIHSVDRPSLVNALGKAMAETDRQPPCFIQVNIGDEKQKGGCAIGDLRALLELAAAQNIDIVGLMCVPPLEREPSPYFALLAKLATDHTLRGLSMGMSDDFPAAIKIGTTHIRVGSALFGGRD